MLYEQNLARGGLDYIENTSRVKKKEKNTRGKEIP